MGWSVGSVGRSVGWLGWGLGTGTGVHVGNTYEWSWISFFYLSSFCFFEGKKNKTKKPLGWAWGTCRVDTYSYLSIYSS